MPSDKTQKAQPAFRPIMPRPPPFPGTHERAKVHLIPQNFQRNVFGPVSLNGKQNQNQESSSGTVLQEKRLLGLPSQQFRSSGVFIVPETDPSQYAASNAVPIKHKPVRAPLPAIEKDLSSSSSSSSSLDKCPRNCVPGEGENTAPISNVKTNPANEERDRNSTQDLISGKSKLLAKRKISEGFCEGHNEEKAPLTKTHNRDEKKTKSSANRKFTTDDEHALISYWEENFVEYKTSNAYAFAKSAAEHLISISRTVLIRHQLITFKYTTKSTTSSTNSKRFMTAFLNLAKALRTPQR